MRGWITLMVLAGCGQEYSLESIEGIEPVAPGEAIREVPIDPMVARPDERDVPEAWVELPSHGGSSVAVRQLQGEPVVEETFRFGSDAPTLTDVLFVVDGSTSMASLVDSVRDGMAGLATDGVFPPNTRVAVTNMTPRSFRAPGEVYRSVRRKELMRLEPGFGGLVSEAKLAAVRETLAGEVYAERVDLTGCDAWFEPTERSPDGASCLVAHTQILEASSGVEAGLLAAGQLALATPDLFRPGAAVNIVFVSDTHDPGLPVDHRNYDDLVTVRPDPAQLAAGILKRRPVASVRMHAIAPAEPCTFEGFESPVYHEAAAATGGSSLDICTAEPRDYVQLMRSIAEEGSRPTRAVLALGSEAEQVESVFVGGRPVDFRLEGRALFLDEALPDRAQDVSVRYRTGPASPRVRTR